MLGWYYISVSYKWNIFDDRALLYECIVYVIWTCMTITRTSDDEDAQEAHKKKVEECNLYTNWISMRPQAVAATSSTSIWII